ncbi:MAG: glycoside hydrolase family 25 protein [Candidatus Dormibacteraeota bacterium]|nr:glycoside hydrolase family 25 protein [Candidatus Dormibacteraeota bacterium]MBV9524663.1 glycoside hydrolase family 25 protein [Candidatus Dormibacteraeota bacterium]
MTAVLVCLVLSAVHGSAVTRTAHASTIQGIDVSVWQGSAQGTSVDWQAVANSGVSFAFIRAAEGSSTVDSDFRRNWYNAVAAGVVPGAYLYFHPGDDPVAQANLLVRLLQEVGFGRGDMLPAIDVEVTDSQPQSTVVANLQTTVNAVASAIGANPVIYTSPSWWDTYVGSSAFVTDPLWVANWGVSSPSLPAQGWGGYGCKVWQYTDAGSVPGINGRVDLDQASAGALPYYGSPPSAPLAVPNPPAAAADRSGAQYVVWKGADANLWEAEWKNGSWTGPRFVGMGPLGSPPALTVLPDGSLDVFWKGADSNLWEATASNGTWSGPVYRGMGPLGSPPAVAAWGKEADIFWQGSDDKLYEGVRSGAMWFGARLVSAATVASPPTAVALPATGEQDVFWTGPDSQLWETSWNGTSWTPAAGVGVQAVGTRPAAALLANGDEVVVWCGVDGSVMAVSYSGSNWSTPANVGMGPLGSDPALAAWGKELDVFWQGTDRSLWETFTPTGTTWYGPQKLGMGPLG